MTNEVVEILLAPLGGGGAGEGILLAGQKEIWLAGGRLHLTKFRRACQVGRSRPDGGKNRFIASVYGLLNLVAHHLAGRLLGRFPVALTGIIDDSQQPISLFAGDRAFLL